MIKEIVPLKITEVPTGTQVFDWEVPNEWQIRDAYIADAKEERLVDFKRHNLHVVSYSAPIDAWMTLEELKPHLHTLPAQPDLIPYRTSYYRRTWGFCLSHHDLESMDDQQKYRVVIDSTLAPGSLTYGEAYLPGRSQKEILVSTHVCHPSLANDNLSGVVVAAYLAREIQRLDRRFSYRFLFVPATIGTICWLSNNTNHLRNIHGGLVLAGLGGPGPFTYKRSRAGDTPIDRIAARVLKNRGSHEVHDFVPMGYDERQYCSPGINLPVGSLSRAPYDTYPEYHTSADNPTFLTPEQLFESLTVVSDVVAALESDLVFESNRPLGEPMLSKYNLYSTGDLGPDEKDVQQALLWLLNFSDRQHSLMDIAERSGLPMRAMLEAAKKLEQHDLLRRSKED